MNARIALSAAPNLFSRLRNAFKNEDSGTDCIKSLTIPSMVSCFLALSAAVASGMLSFRVLIISATNDVGGILLLLSPISCMLSNGSIPVTVKPSIESSFKDTCALVLAAGLSNDSTTTSGGPSVGFT